MLKRQRHFRARKKGNLGGSTMGGDSDFRGKPRGWFARKNPKNREEPTDDSV